MPANLTPAYKEAEERYRRAGTDEERLTCLAEMLALIPKHKGTEKLQADIKSRISKLRKRSGTKQNQKRSTWYQVERQGAGQVCLFGPPNSGKSSIVASLTGAPAIVAAYPFSTTAPLAGMMPFEDIQIQLVDTPPIFADTEGWVYHLLRTADLMVMVLDLADDDIITATESLLDSLQAHSIRFLPTDIAAARPMIVVGNKSDAPGAQDRFGVALETIAYHIRGDQATTVTKSPTEPRIPVPVLPQPATQSNGLLGAPTITGAYRPTGALGLMPESTTAIEVSNVTRRGLEDLRFAIFKSLRIVRIYTKRPGQPAEMSDPVILRAGSTVLDAARHLHKDFAARLKFARYWDDREFRGQRVERSHVLTDRAIVEFHV